MDLSFVIVNWNTREYLERCLDSIKRFPPGCRYEVIVVENASSDGSKDMVSNRFPDVRVIENTENRGYAQGNNQAITASEGEYLLLLNPDVELKEGSANALMAFAREHPKAAAVGCRLVGPDGKIQRSVRSFPYPLSVVVEYAGLSALLPTSRRFGRYRMTWFDYSQDMEVDQPMASCLLIRRSAWEDVGSFDTEFPIFFNEVDWLYRAKSRGWEVWFTPRAEVLHHGGASTRQVRCEMVKESHKSLIRFYEKHYNRRMSRLTMRLITAAVNLNSFITSRAKTC